MRSPALFCGDRSGLTLPFANMPICRVAASLDVPARRGEARPARAKPAEAQKVDEKSDRRATAAFETEQRRRERQRQKEEAAAAKALALRKAAMEKTEAELEVAVREHDKTVAAIEQDLAAVQRRADAEQKRWEKLKERLETDLRNAGNGPSGRQVYAAISLSFGSLPRFSLMRLRRCAAARASHSARW